MDKIVPSLREGVKKEGDGKEENPLTLTEGGIQRSIQFVAKNPVSGNA